MKRVVAAVEAGRCVLAVSSALLKDGEVLLALKNRPGLPAVALSGPPVAPTIAPSEDALSRLASREGLFVVIAPVDQDLTGLRALGERVGRLNPRPTVLVVDRSLDTLKMMSAFPGAKLEHLKVSRGAHFFRDLPAAAAPPPSTDAPKASAGSAKAEERSGGAAPLVGREDDVAAVRALLDEGGPIVVVGPEGVGKRPVVEEALAGCALTRLPDLVLGWGSGADTLVGRLSAILSEAGQTELAEVLAQPHDPLVMIAALERGLQAAESLADKVFVIHDLHHVIGREADFFRKGRVELLVRSLLVHRYPLRVIFTSERAPVFYRTAHAEVARIYRLSGIKGRFFHEIFTAAGAPEVSRDRFGPLWERLHGNPFAVRTLAVEVREKDDPSLVENPKALVMAEPDDTEGIRKLLKARMDALDATAKDALARIAHLHYPAARELLGDLGVNRKMIDELTKLGLIEMTGGQGARRFHLHHLVRSCIPLRARTDFEVYARLADVFAKRAESASGLEKLALQQETNRFVVGARGRARARVKLPFPDNDERVEAIGALIRAEPPLIDIAGPKVDEVLAEDPSNAEAWILKADMLELIRADKATIDACFEAAMTHAPVPEVFHQACSAALRRKARPAAISAMDRAITAMPDESRLYTRLGALLLKHGRRPEALDAMQKARDLDPMLPDAYGLLGMARREEGINALSDVNDLLREAVRLAPQDPVQVSRLVDFLLSRARVEADHRADQYAEAKQLLDPVIRGERRAPEACLQLAILVREENGDRERARWLLKQARKFSEKNPERSWRIRMETALLDAADGKTAEAELVLREIAGKEPTAFEPLHALGQVLAMSEQYVAAHGEITKARDRTPMASLERIWCETDLGRLQALIQAKVAAMADWEDHVEPPPEGGHTERAGHVVRRTRATDPSPAPEDTNDPGEAPPFDGDPDAPASLPADQALPDTETDAPGPSEPEEA